MGDHSHVAASGRGRISLSPRSTSPRVEERDIQRATVIARDDPSPNCLTPNNSALLLIDHQIGPLWELEFADTRRAVVELASFATRARLPTIVTAIDPESWGPIIPEVSEALEEAPHLVRTTINAWDDPIVREAIDCLGRTKLVIAGGAGAVGLALCALSARRAEYDVYAPIDASAEFTHELVTRLSRDGVIVTTTKLVITELAGGR
jgi:Isochorismatase family